MLVGRLLFSSASSFVVISLFLFFFFLFYILLFFGLVLSAQPLYGTTALPTMPTHWRGFSFRSLVLLRPYTCSALHSVSPSKSSLLQIPNWPTLAWWRRSKLILFWQLVHGLGPPPLCKLSFVSSRSSYNFRNSNSLEVPSCSSSSHLSSFCLLVAFFGIVCQFLSLLGLLCLLLLLLLTHTLMVTSFLLVSPLKFLLYSLRVHCVYLFFISFFLFFF